MTFLIGLTLGITQIGAQTWRTVQVVKGHVGYVILSNLILSAGFWFSIRFVVERDVPGYVGFSLGAGAVTAFLAWQTKRELDRKRSANRRKDDAA